MIKVLVVDDSALMRREISRILESDPNISVVGNARDGLQVMEKVNALNPDVITMDIEMPRMDGLQALQQVMKESPRPVVMVSSMTIKGAEITIRALELGAFDFVHKPSGSISLDIGRQTDLLIQKVKTAAQSGVRHMKRLANRSRVQSRPPVRSKPRRVMPGKMEGSHIVGIGVSTGGPHTLMEMLPQIPGDLNISILIVQHMPEKFTASLARRLDSVCPMNVKEAEEGEIVERGGIYIAPGGKHMRLVSKNQKIRFIEIDKSREGHDINRPSVDVLFESLNDALSNHWLGVILTGMGADGSKELLRLRQSGGHTIAEAQETCTVFGMPKRAIEKGAAEFVLPVHKIPQKIEEMFTMNLF